MLPNFLKQVISYFKKFPGIGEKTAERMALYLVEHFSKDDLDNFSKNIAKINIDLKHCQNCNIITENELCITCTNPNLDKKLMIVESSLDVYSFMKINIYSGYYFVLGNLINFQKGIDAKALNIEKLLNNINNNNYDEIIIATNSTLEGEITAAHIRAIIEELKPDLKISRLAYGLPSGTDLKYADSETLRQSIINRIKF